MFEVATPDSAEDKSNTLKHFQKNINDYIVSRTKIKSEEINDKIFKRDWWMTGKEALEYGVVDHLIVE